MVRDIVLKRIEALTAGEVPIHEEGLAELFDRNRDRLRFTLEIGDVVETAGIAFVCVGTPPLPSGDADLSVVWRVVDELAGLGDRLVLGMRSTVMRTPLIVDGRNLLQPATVRAAGFAYESVGRPSGLLSHSVQGLTTAS